MWWPHDDRESRPNTGGTATIEDESVDIIGRQSSARRPAAPSFDLHREGGPTGWLLALLRVLDQEPIQRPFEVGALSDDSRAPVGADPPQAAPVFVVQVDEEAHAWLRADVDETLQPTMPLWFLVDHEPQRVAFKGEHHGNEVWRSIGSDRRQPGNARAVLKRARASSSFIAGKRTSHSPARSVVGSATRFQEVSERDRPFEADARRPEDYRERSRGRHSLHHAAFEA